METITKNLFLEFNPDTLISIRKSYNFDNAARMNEAIDILEEWIKKQDHFVKKSFPREYLERVIIFSKGSVERAKIKLDKLCYHRSMSPKFFELFNKDKINITCAIMPKLTPDHYRVLVSNNYFKDGVNKGYLDLYKYISYMLEYMFRNDYSGGIVSVVDYRETNIVEMMKHLNFLELKQHTAMAMEGFGIRIKGVHMLTSSKAIDLVVALFKKVMSDKLGERIHVHTSLESLYEYVPKEILPMEYGGNEKPLAQMQELLIDALTSTDNIEYMNDMQKACTKEEYRQKEDLRNDSLPGTFMTLNLD